MHEHINKHVRTHAYSHEHMHACTNTHTQTHGTLQEEDLEFLLAIVTANTLVKSKVFFDFPLFEGFHLML